MYSLDSPKLTRLNWMHSHRDASESLVHSYHKSFNGFAAKLTKDEVQKLAGN